MSRLALLEGSPYRQYVYGYPHKTAYRALPRPRALADVWATEPACGVTLYVHVPFCEMRCGFCNLFTAAQPVDDVVSSYLDAVDREAAALAEALGPRAHFARATIGGGTPTFLAAPQLVRVLRLMERVARRSLVDLDLCVEVSPATATAQKLAVLQDAGVARISMGVQSFLEHESAALRRPQSAREVSAALERLRAMRLKTLNLDLIYGLEGQTVGSFLESIAVALRWAPEELYLYPLYVRPLTLLGRTTSAPRVDPRTELYRAGRDLLLGSGYRQVSMRMFRRADAGEAEVARCQDDATVGLGCGARSYTRSLHYSQEWAVAPRAVRSIIAAYADRSDDELRIVRHGFELDGEEQRRRYVILGLLTAAGLALEDYGGRFGTAAIDDFPQLAQLVDAELAVVEAHHLRLTARGLERSDAIGPWLHSPEVEARMRSWEAR